ncbi:MAG: hypothetical protein HY811_11035 [Planctomycetes bacterium]|nr:hypothetical protein [Planctomycetota bacterium]
MIVHKREISGKICPMLSKKDDTNCLGESCMMWRWAYPFKTQAPYNDQGYCGLAGRPEMLIQMPPQPEIKPSVRSI